MPQLKTPRHLSTWPDEVTALMDRLHVLERSRLAAHFQGDDQAADDLRGRIATTLHDLEVAKAAAIAGENASLTAASGNGKLRPGSLRGRRA